MPNTQESEFFRPKFSNNQNKAFAQALKKEVNDYFTANAIPKHGGNKFLVKLPVMFALYLAPFVCILLGEFSFAVNLCLWTLMGFGMAAIGLAIMHDANHKNACKNQGLNKLLSYSISFLGGSPVLWRIQHNVLHHTYTNIEQLDEDLSAIGLLRFSPNDKLKKVHKYQHWYAWLFYSLLTINWAGHDDYLQLKRYRDMGLLSSQKTTYIKEVWGITLTKLLYYGYLIALPIAVTPFAWWQIVIGFVLMHMVAGLLLSVIFQSAHVTTSSYFPKNNELVVEENWFVHQLKTTKNFAMKCRPLTWFIGGLNHQIEHHLFPNISHVHYAKLAPIVKQVATAHNVPYYESRTFFGAVKDHYLFLKQLGKSQ